MKGSKITVIVAMGFILTTFLLGQEIEKKISEKYADFLYPVKYQRRVVPQMFPGGGQEVTRYALGIAIREDIILISSDYFVNEFSQIEKQNFVYIIIDEKTEIKAKFIGEDKETKLCYFKVTEEDKKLKFIDVGKIKEATLLFGENVLILDRFLIVPEFNFPVQVKSKKIEAIVNKPTVEYLIEGIAGLFRIQPLALVFNSKGELAGIISLSQNRKKDETSQQNPPQPWLPMATDLLVIKPIGFLQKAVSQIPKEIKKGWLGFFGDSLEFITKEEAEEFLKLKSEQKGLRVTSVMEETPVFKSGLKAGDIILKIGDVDCVVKEAREIPTLIEKISNSLEVGKTIKIKYLRKNEQGIYMENETEVKIEEKPIEFEDTEEYEEDKLGIRVKELTIDYKYRNKISSGVKGLVITFVKGGGPAAIAGIIGGDILLSLSIENKEKEVLTIAELKKLIAELSQSKPKEISAKILVGKETKIVTLRNINW